MRLSKILSNAILIRINLTLALLILPSIASGLPITFPSDPSIHTTPKRTTVYRSNNILAGPTAGITLIGSVTVTDDGSADGGDPGSLSGFDLDFIFLDDDGNVFDDNGNFTTTGNDSHPIVFANFKKPGKFREPPMGTSFDERFFLQPRTFPNGTPNFVCSEDEDASLDNRNRINDSCATLTSNGNTNFDVQDIGDIRGALSLGDSGVLTAIFNFSPGVTQTELYLIVGEVGGQENLGASFSVEPGIIPEPGTFLLFGTGLIGLIAYRYRTRSCIGKPGQSE